MFYICMYLLHCIVLYCIVLHMVHIFYVWVVCMYALYVCAHVNMCMYVHQGLGCRVQCIVLHVNVCIVLYCIVLYCIAYVVYILCMVCVYVCVICVCTCAYVHVCSLGFRVQGLVYCTAQECNVLYLIISNMQYTFYVWVVCMYVLCVCVCSYICNVLYFMFIYV